MVAVSANLIGAGTRAGVSLDRTIVRSLTRIASLLPGPPSQIEIVPGSHVINGKTEPATGRVVITVNPRDRPSALKRTFTKWLPNTLAHEVDHSVRIQAGPGFGSTLGDQLISEGLSSAFDIQLQPRIRLPWVHALSAPQERRMWARARPLLGKRGLYDQWFLGGDGVPHWSGFQIGYHIVHDYLKRHPDATAASIVNLPAASILAGSHYAP